MQEIKIRELSKQLYGNSYRLEVAAAIADAHSGIITVADLAVTLVSPENSSVIRLELEHLVEAELLVRLPRPKGQRVQYYQRMPSEYWTGARLVLEELRARTASRSRQA